MVESFSMIDLQKKTLLILSPHPDDEVIGCAGLMQKVRAAGGKVFVLYFTVGMTKDFGKQRTSRAQERTSEIRRVVRMLGVHGWRLALPGDEYHLRLDGVPQKRLIHEIERGKKISLEEVRPDILAVPWVHDYNQDHRAVAQAALAATRPSPRADKFTPDFILTYESPMNQWSVSGTALAPNFYVTLTAAHMKKKVKAMGLYTSQVRRATHPRNGGSLTALARLRGAMVGEPFAEGFVCQKLVM